MSKWKNESICPACGEPNDGDLEFCEFCGEDLRPKEDREKETRPSGGILSVLICVVMIVFILIRALTRNG